MSFSFIANSVQDTLDFAKKFADVVRETGAFVCMFGDIGAGKTVFVRETAKNLNVTQKVTSPSFVILNEYKSGDLPIYHFDLYRLEKEGISTIAEELSEYSTGKILTFVEWAEFSPDTELPFDRVIINIEYIDENSRKITVSSMGEKSQKIIEALK